MKLSSIFHLKYSLSGFTSYNTHLLEGGGHLETFAVAIRIRNLKSLQMSGLLSQLTQFRLLRFM
jgi:hypothetical protein